MKRKKPPLWRGKQAMRVRYALTPKAHEYFDLQQSPIEPFAATFAASLAASSARKNTQAMPPTGLVDTPDPGAAAEPCDECGDNGGDPVFGVACPACGKQWRDPKAAPEQSLMPAEPAPSELWPVPQTRSSTLPPVAELSELVLLHVRGEGGAATSRAIRNAMPARLIAWVDDALRALRDMGQLQCLTLGGEHVWRLR